MLKAELKRLLVARSKDGGKTISIAPAAPANAVTDLVAYTNAAGTTGTLFWTEVLPGDCNNDGQVDIVDLQPIVVHYGEASTGPGSPAYLADANGDGQVGIDDLQPVANNYAAHLQGYQVWRGHWNGTSTDWEITPRPNPNAANPNWSADRPSPPPVSARPAYTFADDISALIDKANVRYKVVAYGDTASGAESNQAALSPPVGLADTAWPKFRGNARNTGQSPYVGAQTNTIKWTFMTGSTIDLASPCIGVDGTVYIGSDDGFLYAVNPSDGSLKWKSQVGAWRTCAAVGADGTVYIGGVDGYIHALNPLDGSEKWKTFLAVNGAAYSPAIGSDGTVYAGCPVSMASNDTFFALSPGDGSIKWKQPLGNVSSPAIGADGTIYVGSGDRHVYAVNPADGSTDWAYPAVGGATTPAVGADGTIYFGSGDDNVYALNPDGTLKWKHATGDMVYSSPAISTGGRVYAGSYDSKVYALNASDGSLVWAFPTRFWAEGSPALGADGTIYTSAWDFYSIAPDGTQKWTLSGIGDAVSSPAIGADGTVYFGSENSLYAISP